MAAPPNQPPGGRPPYPQGQPNQGFDPRTGQPVQQGPVYQQPAYPQPQYQQPAYQQPQPGQPVYQVMQGQVQYGTASPMPGQQPMPGQIPMQPPRKPDETLGMVSAGLGAASFFFGLSILAAIPAVIVGGMARKRARQSPDLYGGESLAKVGMVLGWVNIGLTVLAAIAVIASFVLPFCFACVAGVVGVAAGA